MTGATWDIISFVMWAVMAVLLAAMIVYCIQLSRQIKHLKSQEMAGLVQQLNQLVDKIDKKVEYARGIAERLERQAARAEKADQEISDCLDQLSDKIRRGNRLADQLAQLERDIADQVAPTDRSLNGTAYTDQTRSEAAPGPGEQKSKDTDGSAQISVPSGLKVNESMVATNSEATKPSSPRDDASRKTVETSTRGLKRLARGANA